jgi:hypothetical protein
MLLPDSIDRDTLSDFVGARKDAKKPMTERAVTMLLRKLARLEAEGHCPNLLMERSILNGWQDVYPDESTKAVRDSFVSTHTDRSWRESFTDTDRSWGDNVKAIR